MVVRSESASVMNHQRESARQPGGPVTPRSAPEKVPGHSKPRGEIRTRLLNKFNSMTIELEHVEQSQGASEVYSRQNSHPAQTESIAKGPWACISTGYVTREGSLHFPFDTLLGLEGCQELPVVP